MIKINEWPLSILDLVIKCNEKYWISKIIKVLFDNLIIDLILDILGYITKYVTNMHDMIGKINRHDMVYEW